jgi:serine/threonine protein kinase
LISRILVGDPEERLTVDEIMDHPWMNQVEQIPDFLPESTLFEPPTAAFLKQYLPEELGGAYKDDQTPLEYELKVQEWRNNQIAGIANKRINLGKNPNTIAPQDGLGQDLTLIRAQQDEEILRKIELEK